MAHHHILVTGGTGAVGRHVVRQLAAREDCTPVFTAHTAGETAETLTAETGAACIRVDLRDTEALEAALTALDPKPDVVIHCAATLNADALEALSLDAWSTQMAVNTTAPFLILRHLAPSWKAAGSGRFVVLGALDRGQSLPIPAGFAATQGALSAFVMAAGRELGAHGVRINMISSGLLEEGLSKKLDPAIFEDYTTFSAFRRLGKPEEIARAAVWLALENTYMNGKILPINGGI